MSTEWADRIIDLVLRGEPTARPTPGITLPENRFGRTPPPPSEKPRCIVCGLTSGDVRDGRCSLDRVDRADRPEPRQFGGDYVLGGKRSYPKYL